MTSLRKTIAVGCLSLLALPALAQVNVTTWQVDLAHSGNNAQETILTPGNVASPGNFGLLYTQPTDGQTYGQTLIASGVSINGTAHNVAYVATEHGSIYAFDADTNTGANASPLWKVSLVPAGTVPVPQSVVGSGDIGVELGITTTPVIDPATSTIYIVSKVQQTSNTTYHQYLYALDLATGALKTNPSVSGYANPIEISAANGVQFPGTGAGAVNNVIPFEPLREHLRCAMALYNGIVYLAYASHSDTDPYHGEVIGFDANTLKVAKLFIATPTNGTSKGGIWQSGASPAIDSLGNLYVATGNGAWDQSVPSYGTNWGESFLKLPTSGTFSVSYSNTLNWFTPNNWQTLNNGDVDLGAGGLLLLPDQTGGTHRRLMVGGGKGGVLYVIDRDNMGGVNTPNRSVQEIQEIDGNSIFTTPAYFNGYIYYSSAGGPLTQRAVAYNSADGSYVSATPTVSNDVYNNKGDGCFVSSNGVSNGVVWILTGSGVKVYDAKNVSGDPIYKADSTVPGNPSIGCQNTKFSLPTVANGKLYYTAYKDSTNAGYLFVYGLLPRAVGTPDAPSDATAKAVSSRNITVTWTSHSTNESGFKIKRSTNATSGFTQVPNATGTTTGAGVTSYTDSGLAASTDYYYQVVASNANGDSSATNVAKARTFPTYVENGLVAYWNLDDTGTSLADVTGNGHTGTLSGEANAGASGFVNTGVYFHGTGQIASRVTVPDTSDGALRFTAAQSFTLSAWVNPEALRSSEETIVSKSRDTGNSYGIAINASNQWTFRGASADVVGTAATQNAWTHVTVVQNAAAATGQPKRLLYVNGVLAGSSTTAQAADGTGDLWIAQQNVTGNVLPFPGYIDEVRLYNRALSASEVTGLMGPPVLEAHSTQVHGTAGSFDFTMWPYLAKKIEPRKGAVTGAYQIVLNFPATVSGITATLTAQDGGSVVGSAGSVTYDTTGKVATVPLTGVGNAQNLFVHLAGIQPGNGTANIPFNVLWGDANSDNIVNALDASIIAHLHTTIVGGATAADDLNCDGAVNSADDTVASAAVGTSLGAQSETNLAFFQTATALSSNGSNTPDLAVDNLTAANTSRWESVQKVDPQWIYVDLGGVCSVNTVIFNWENAAGADYNIEISNDKTNWTLLKHETANTGGGIKTYTGLNGTGQYVRMYGNTRTGPYGYSLWDFEVLGLSGTANSYAPTVNSALTLTIPAGGSVNYQIRGTNSPTGYAAAGLPSSLSVNTSTGLITGTMSQAGSFPVTIKASNGVGTGSATLTISVVSGYTGWQSTYFTAAELNNPSVSGPTATPAGDGITNLMKYALGLDPKKMGVAGLPVQSISNVSGQNYLTMTYTRPLSTTDLTYTPKVSGDLATWSSGTTYTSSTATNNGDGKTQTVVVRDLTPMNVNRRFMELSVTQPAQ